MSILFIIYIIIGSAINDRLEDKSTVKFSFLEQCKHIFTWPLIVYDDIQEIKKLLKE